MKKSIIVAGLLALTSMQSMAVNYSAKEKDNRCFQTPGEYRVLVIVPDSDEPFKSGDSWNPSSVKGYEYFLQLSTGKIDFLTEQYYGTIDDSRISLRNMKHGYSLGSSGKTFDFGTGKTTLHRESMPDYVQDFVEVDCKSVPL